MTYGHLRADCLYTGIIFGPSARYRVWKAFTFTLFCWLRVRATESKPEFYMNSSTVTNNQQHGLFLENVRNYIIVNASSVTYNGYGAGIRIYSGAGTDSCVSILRTH